MIIPDVNLLVFAYDSSSPHHAAAARWWQQCMTGNDSDFLRFPGIRWHNPLTGKTRST